MLLACCSIINEWLQTNTVVTAFTGRDEMIVKTKTKKIYV